MPPRQNVFCAPSPGGLSRKRQGSPAPSSMDWTRPSRRIRLGLPPETRRSLACTNMIESVYSVGRQVFRNVKRRRNDRNALRWTGAGRLKAGKGLRRLEAHKQLPVLKTALESQRKGRANDAGIDRQTRAA